MKIYKKIMTITLSVAVGVSSIQADWLSDQANSGFFNVTPGANFNMNGKHISTTPSVYYRFGPSAMNYEPLYYVSPPDISVSCSGFNMKGLFVSILGWDRISKMLKSSGSSFAWGVVVGLVYSLPGIFSSFKMLNTWAKKIQQLLQNSCKIGTDAGKAFSETIGVDKSLIVPVKNSLQRLDNFTPEAATKATDSLNKQGERSMFGKVMNTLNSSGNDLFGNSDNDTDPTPEEKANTQRLIMQSAYIYSPGSSFIRNVLNTSLALGQESKVYNYLYSFGGNDNKMFVSKDICINLQDNTNQYSMNINKLVNKFGLNTVDQKRNEYLNFIRAVLFRNLGNYKVIDGLSATKAKDVFNKAVSEVTANNKEIGTASKILSGEVAPFKSVPKPPNADVKSAAYFGMYLGYSMIGVSDLNDDIDTELLNAIKRSIGSWQGIPYAVFSSIEGKTSSNKMSFISETKGNNLHSPDNIDLFSSGFENKLKINEPFRKKSFNFIDKIVNQDKDPHTAAAEVDIPLLSSITYPYLQILKQTPNKDREPLINLLADYNVCLFGIGVLDSFSKNRMFDPTTNSFYLLKDNKVMASEYTLPDNNTPPIDNDILSSFREGLSFAILSQISIESLSSINEDIKTISDLKISCAKIKKSAENSFRDQNIENRKNAAAATQN